jgi:peptidoglycan/xylan/chitin deacetylase (PgdA/CDA1 family)
MFKQLAKEVVFRVGAFSLLQRVRNRGCLTVLMFHRVLPERESVRLGADPLYTLTPELFENVLAFVKRHYTPVSLENVLAARERTKPLPEFPLLVTFDDGWSDNLQYAQPILERARIPWVLFVNTGMVAEPACWWQEALLWALRTNMATFDVLWSNTNANAGAEPPPRTREPGFTLLLRYGAIPATRREELLRPYINALGEVYRGKVALDANELRDLRQKGVAVGAHGSSHLPLPLVDAPADIAAAKEWLSINTDASIQQTMSFPHGRYDATVVSAAREAGYRLIFTSDPFLNPCPEGFLSSDLIGRIPVSTDDVANASGKLSGGQLSTWLFLRDRRAHAQMAV